MAQPKPATQPQEIASDLFPYGTEWVRADFHLHTKADKEFVYDGDDNTFVGAYVDKLKQEGIRLGVITNHNKFAMEEFKALRKRARKEAIGLLPGVELSVNDGANGVHTLVSTGISRLGRGSTTSIAADAVRPYARAFHANATRSRLQFPLLPPEPAPTARQNFQSMQSPECQTP
jgi:hypothetical protein